MTCPISNDTTYKNYGLSMAFTTENPVVFPALPSENVLGGGHQVPAMLLLLKCLVHRQDLSTMDICGTVTLESISLSIVIYLMIPHDINIFYVWVFDYQT